MDTITRRDLLEVVNYSGDRFVSLYLPKQNAGHQHRQDHIRLKNLLSQADTALRETGLSALAVQKMLEPAHRLFHEPVMLEKSTGGLAVLLAPDRAQVWHLSTTCQEQCVVGKHPFVIPLLYSQAENETFYVLAVSQNHVKLLHGARHNLEPVAVPGLPKNLDDALHYDQREPTLQAHSGRPQLRGKESAVFHGQGGLADVGKQDLESYFREIDRSLAGVLRQDTQPLLFAGVDYLLPIYREVNTYPHLLPQHISGNPDSLSNHELQQRAWPIIQALLDERCNQAITKYGNLAVRNQASDRLEEILVAAHSGAVDTLFIDPAVRRPGSFDPQTSAVRIDENPQSDSEDLVNLAAIFVLRSGGGVHAVESGSVLGAGPVAAVFRYVLPPIAAGAS